MRKKWVIISVIMIAVSVLFTFMMTKIDVKPIGPMGSEVGFSSINKVLTPKYDETFYKISKYAGYLALVIPVIYVIVGAKQLIEGKALFKVDKRLFKLAVFYVAVLATYIFFEKVVINYRPVILEDGLEASYPSSHTLMSICFCLSAIIMNNAMFKKKPGIGIFNGLLGLLCGVVILTRFISGVHWFTDIIGSVIIASTLLSMLKIFIIEDL